jgi:hypothetical protein
VVVPSISRRRTLTGFAKGVITIRVWGVRKANRLSFSGDGRSN